MPSKKTDEEIVGDYLRDLDHPLKKEIEAVRQIIKSADKRISERIKWNAPSYYYNVDMVTFNPRDQKRVHLVWHHPSIETITSKILEGDYKARRMSYFKDMKEVEKSSREIQKIIKQLMSL